MNGDTFIAWLESLKASIQAELTGYTCEIREPNETELAKRTAWIVVEDLEDDTRVADFFGSVQIAAVVYVTVIYEVSETPEHYVARLRRRIQTTRAVQRAVRAAPSSLILRFEGETAFITEGLYASASRVRVAFQESV